MKIKTLVANNDLSHHNEGVHINGIFVQPEELPNDVYQQQTDSFHPSVVQTQANIADIPVPMNNNQNYYHQQSLDEIDKPPVSVSNFNMSLQRADSPQALSEALSMQNAVCIDGKFYQVPEGTDLAEVFGEQIYENMDECVAANQISDNVAHGGPAWIVNGSERDRTAGEMCIELSEHDCVIMPDGAINRVPEGFEVPDTWSECGNIQNWEHEQTGSDKSYAIWEDGHLHDDIAYYVSPMELHFVEGMTQESVGLHSFPDLNGEMHDELAASHITRSMVFEGVKENERAESIDVFRGHDDPAMNIAGAGDSAQLGFGE